jgi:methionine synthase II (cobalamin-independent)
VVEKAEEIADQLILAGKYIPPDQLGATDDCGMILISALNHVSVYNQLTNEL